MTTSGWPPTTAAGQERKGPRWVALDVSGYYGPVHVPHLVMWARSGDAVPTAIDPYNEFTEGLVGFARDLMEEGAPALEIAVRASTGHRGGLISADDFEPSDPWWYTGDPRLFDQAAWDRANPDLGPSRQADDDPYDDHIRFLDEAEIGQVLDRIARLEPDTWPADAVRDEVEDIKRLDALDPSLLEHVARSELERDPHYPWFDLLARALFAQGRWAEAQEAMLRERPEIEPDDPAHVQQFIELVQSRIERDNVRKVHEYLVDSVNAAREGHRDLDDLLKALTDLAKLDTSSMDQADVLLPQQAWARLALRFLVGASRATGWYPRSAWFDLSLRGHIREIAERTARS